MQTLTSPTRAPRTAMPDRPPVHPHPPPATPCTALPLRPSPTPQQPRYSHPYGIQSTSSGVLSSSRGGTSSPNTVISTHSYQQHKSTQSMKSLLRNSSSVDDLASNAHEHTAASERINKENNVLVMIEGGGKYDSVRTRKRTLAQRASMSDLASSTSAIRHEKASGPEEWELDIMASPRKKVAEMREVLMMHGRDGRACISGVGDAACERWAEGETWKKELEKLPPSTRRLSTSTSVLSMKDEQRECHAGVLRGSGGDHPPHEEDRRGGAEFQLPPFTDGVQGSPSHVRRVVGQFDAHMFNDFRSPSGLRQDTRHGNDDDDVFFSQSGFERYKPRTTSASSLQSVNSIFSSATDTDTCDAATGRHHNVTQRALQFEMGVVGRSVPKTAEEREGRVLDASMQLSGDDERRSHDCRLRSRAEDVFGDAGKTIKPRKSARAPSLSTSAKYGLTPAQVVVDEVVGESALGSLAPAVPEPSATHHQALDVPDNRSTPEKDTEILDNTHERSSVPATRQSLQEEGQDSQDMTAEQGAPKHMSRMAQHEKAGLRPYGALRRAYTSPVSSGTSPTGLRQQRVGGKFPRLPTMGMVVVSAPVAENGPFAKEAITNEDRVIALRGPVSNNPPDDTLNLFNFEPPGDPSRLPVNPPLNDSASLSDTTKRLALAEARIQDLEQALAEVLQRQKDMVLGKTDAVVRPGSASLAKDEIEASDGGDESSSNPAGDKHRVTISDWLAWLSGGCTTPSPSPWPSTSTAPSMSAPFAGPANVRQIPGYVFLVGIGLSVIVVRTVFLNPYSRSNK